MKRIVAVFVGALLIIAVLISNAVEGSGTRLYDDQEIQAVPRNGE